MIDFIKKLLETRLNKKKHEVMKLKWQKVKLESALEKAKKQND